MPYLTYEKAREVHKALATNKSVYVFVRRWAAGRYNDRMVAQGIEDFDCGSSDVSIELTEALRFYEVPLIGPVQDAYADAGVPLTRDEVEVIDAAQEREFSA
jgi:hypothetical protein